MRTKRTEQIALIAEQEKSGETVRQFCERKGIQVRTFQQWKIRLRKSATRITTKESRVRATNATSKNSPAAFIPVQLLEGTPVTKQKQDTQSIIIHVGPTVRLECRGPVDARYLEETLKVVVRLCGQI